MLLWKPKLDKYILTKDIFLSFKNIQLMWKQVEKEQYTDKTNRKLTLRWQNEA